MREETWVREGGPEPQEQWLEKEFSFGVAILIAVYFVVLGIIPRALHILRSALLLSYIPNPELAASSGG